ncbi:hypothetical protein [Xanthomonas sacchari]|uniref:hypothetical protein n=1 Tax=Xanthomonas sacchari TaxID=56458 RepID=UPI00225E4F19|nr:hypothetical protein [Xanthomonas sacchari]MCW0435089.1 hypothetical protein [Xanthomonas sacchari]
MSKRLYKSNPPLKVCEWPVEQGGGAYISFEEYVDIPGLEDSDIRIEFERTKSLAEVTTLANKLREAGFVFVVQK